MRKLLLLPLLFISCFAFADVVFEDFENISLYRPSKAPNAVISVSQDKGLKGKSVRIDYDLTNDHFVEIGRPAKIDISAVSQFYWYVRGDVNGSLLEIKFINEDGSVYGKKIPLYGVSESQWKKITLPRKEIRYMWGGNKKLSKIKEFYIAVSRGAARKGWVAMDNFTYSPYVKGAPEFEINLNQVGYHPTDRKFFIVRVIGGDSDKDVSGTFAVQETIDKNNAATGKLKKINFKDWSGIYLRGDFDELDAAGNYEVKVKLETKYGTLEKTSYKFKVNPSVISSLTLMAELAYLDYQRCGIRCHKHDPVMGGWHDTLFDISKRMWSTPSLLYGLARYVQDGPVHAGKTPEGAFGDMDELVWGIKFMTEMPDADGALSWGGIEADFSKSMTYDQFIARLGPLKPEDDLLPRIKYNDQNLHATAFNIAALVNAAAAVKAKDPGLAKKAEETANRAWNWLDTQSLNEARDYGAYLWAATELYKFNSNKKYLYRVNELVPKLLELQALDFRKFENASCGDFYTSKAFRDFRFQYKYVSFNIAINQALINLSEILKPEEDPLWFDIFYANYVFGENYIKGKASKSPYGQMALGLEQVARDKSSQAGPPWELGLDKGSSGGYEIAKEGGTNHIKLDFDFATGNWLQITQKLDKDLSSIAQVSFEYRYTGDPNVLEIKLNDKTDSTFGARIQLANTDRWTIGEINMGDFKYFWGNNNVLDLKNVRNLWFAIARKDGGAGSFLLRNIQLVRENDTVIKMPIFNAAEDARFELNYFAGPEAEKAAASNHGLNCDHLGMAYTAMRWAYQIDDPELEVFADNQVNWVLGTNPLNFCMLLGAGTENPVIMADYFGKPRLPGLIPNGIVPGENRNPDWWGDGASSGEDWLPHNAAYFAAISLVDSQGYISGKILSSGVPVQNAEVEISDGPRVIAKLKSRPENGTFGPLQVVPQKTYTITVRSGNKELKRSSPVLSGERRKFFLDFARDFSIDIKLEGKPEAGKKAVFRISVPKSAVGRDYRVYLKGARMAFPGEGKITSETASIPIVPDGDKPVMLMYLIKGYPPVYKTFYIKSM
jgi:hypothetical protein